MSTTTEIERVLANAADARVKFLAAAFRACLARRDIDAAITQLEDMLKIARARKIKRADCLAATAQNCDTVPDSPVRGV